MTSVYLAILRGACSWPAAALPPVTMFLIHFDLKSSVLLTLAFLLSKKKCVSFKNESCARHQRHQTKRTPLLQMLTAEAALRPHHLNSVQELLAFAQTCSIPKMSTRCLRSTLNILPRKFHQVVPSSSTPLFFLLPWMLPCLVFFLLV